MPLHVVNPITLVIVAFLGVGGSLALAGLLVYRTYQQAKWQQQQLVQQQQQSSTTWRSTALFVKHYVYLSVGLTIAFLVVITTLLIASQTVQHVRTLVIALAVATGIHLASALLLSYWFSKRQQQSSLNDYTGTCGTITCVYSSDDLADQYDNVDDEPCTPTKRVLITATRTLRAIGIFYLYLTTLALSLYAIGTLRGNNPAFEDDSFYHGPAPILSYQGDNVNYDNVARKATITVGYAGAWACPNQNQNDNDNDSNSNANEWCEQSVDLFWCDVYDKTGYWAGNSHGKMEPTWRLWEGEDLWAESGFSCARGMYNSNNAGDDNDEEEDKDDNQQQQQQYLNDPFDAPYLINVFATCDGTCQLVIDDPFFRAKFYHVSSMKHLMVWSFVAAIVFLSAARILLYWRTKRKTESKSLKESAGVELLPSLDETDASNSKKSNKQGVVA